VKGRKNFFFEKKKQKTFLLRFARSWNRPRPKTNKVFARFFQKAPLTYFLLESI